MDFGASNVERANWAAEALAVFCEETGLDSELECEEAVGDLIANLGHYCDELGLDFVDLVAGAVGIWDVEKREQANGEPNAMYPLYEVKIEIIAGH